MKKMFPVFALGALMLFVVSCEKETDGIDNKEEQGTENADTFFVEAIDLGLSVKWAEHNVGANKPEEYGNYYAWGEIEETSTHKYWNDKNGNGYADSDEYENIGTNISGTSYDVAHVKWGDGWRMPTIEEIKELCDKCSWRWTTVNGVNGQRVIGPSGDSIFLPAAHDYRGFCWSGTLGESGTYGAYCLSFNSNGWRWYYNYERISRLNVRPVTE